MRVFVSYSFIDKELYLLTLLVSKLKEKGNFVQLSDSNYQSENYIYNTEFFVGLITNHSHSINNVFNEWQIAEKYNKNRILLIEEGVNVYRNDIKYIRFNRNNPDAAIRQLFQENDKKAEKKSTLAEEIVKAGAVIAGIAAVISLLGGENSKKK